MIEPLAYATGAEWLSALRAAFRTLHRTALMRGPSMHVALAGGRTPAPFYRLLAGEPLAWDRIQWWMGDERVVPADQPGNNGHMAREGFARAGPQFNFHPWDTRCTPEESARRYEEDLRSGIGARPVFDLILLGLGDDGHTASLFPGSPALDENIREAVAAPGPPPHPRRLTLTFPVLNRARECWFLVGGKTKDAMVRRLADGDRAIPAGRVDGPKLKLFWLRSSRAHSG